MRLEGAARSRAHFEYARKYAERGDARSTKKAIAHFGRGMAYGAPGAPAYDERVLSNAGPYTYRWKLNPDSRGANQYHYATIDVKMRGKKSLLVATIDVYENGTENGVVDVHASFVQSRGPGDLKRQYIAREVASVIRYMRRSTRKMNWGDSWGRGFDPFGDSSWENIEVHSRNGCWPRLGGNSADKENEPSPLSPLGSSKKASPLGPSSPLSPLGLSNKFRNLAIRGERYAPLDDDEETRARPTRRPMTTYTSTNGGLSYRVSQVESDRYTVDVLNDGGCPVAYSEFHFLDTKANGKIADLGNNTKLADEERKEPTLAYVMLACMSLIRIVHGVETIRTIGTEAEFDAAQWVHNKVEAMKVEKKEKGTVTKVTKGPAFR